MKLSIVIPVYNSVETLDTLHAEIAKAMGGMDYELILVDDRSPDRSWEKIVAIRNADPEHVRGVRLAKNSGQHNAILCGFSFAQGDAVLTMDDDLQHPPSEIPKLLNEFSTSNADVVYGIYPDKRHSRIRNAGSSFVKQSSKIMAGNTGEGSSFRLMKRRIADEILSHRYQSHLFIDEVLHWYTNKITVVNVEHHKRKAGKSGYTFLRLAAMYLDILINYTAIPLKLMTWMGLFSSFITFLLGLRFIYIKLAHQVQPGFTAIIVTVLFATSLLMFCMGITGQYLYKLYRLQNRRPTWFVQEVV